MPEARLARARATLPADYQYRPPTWPRSPHKLNVFGWCDFMPSQQPQAFRLVEPGKLYDPDTEPIDL
jgi:hypothetical protein